jgi:hypothetical protein
MDLGNIKEVSEVSQNAQKYPRRLRMASTSREREKLKVPKTSLKQHDCEERVTRFPTAQTARQTELRIKSYKRSKFSQTWSNEEKVRVTRGTLSG